MAADDGDVRVVTDVVWLCYHQLGIVDGGDSFPAVRPRRTNALVDVYEGAAVVATGIHTGVVTVTAEVRSGPPASVDLDSWDEIVEVSVDMPGGDGRLTVLMSAVPETFPCLTPAGRGTYRLRAHARGRDIAIDGTASEPFERYCLVVWPAPPAPQVIHKETDRYGAGWHAYDPAAPPLTPPTRDEWDPSRQPDVYGEPQRAPGPAGRSSSGPTVSRRVRRPRRGDAGA